MEVMSGELEDAEQRGPGGRERERNYCVAEERSCVWHYKGLKYHRSTRPWGLAQHGTQKGLQV